MVRNAVNGARNEPDDIEREIINIITAIPAQARAEKWPTDERSRLRRRIGKWWAKFTRAGWREVEKYDDKIFTEQWMYAIISHLDKLGFRLGYTTIRNNPYRRRYSWELMWDFAWLKRDGEYRLDRIPLVFEIAVGKGDVSDKLVSARADHRVVVIDRGDFGLGDSFENFEGKVVYSGMTQKGDRYLCFRFNRDTCEFEYHNFVARKR